MGFFWANVKANIEGAVANAKMHYYEEKLRSDDYDEDLSLIHISEPTRH